jgi:ADP-glucose pyrophosphorylase
MVVQPCSQAVCLADLMLQVMAYNFPDYWVDIGGSVGEFYDFNM